jgi:phage-related tail fiber protein
MNLTIERAIVLATQTYVEDCNTERERELAGALIALANEVERLSTRLNLYRLKAEMGGA